MGLMSRAIAIAVVLLAGGAQPSSAADRTFRPGSLKFFSRHVKYPVPRTQREMLLYRNGRRTSYVL